jgi:hypothetical protein
LPGYTRNGQDCLEFRPEEELGAIAKQVERFDAQSVAGQHKPALAAIPDRESKHAAQAIHQVRAHLLVEMNENLGVAPSA